jgi:hypothetical protein
MTKLKVRLVERKVKEDVFWLDVYEGNEERAVMFDDEVGIKNYIIGYQEALWNLAKQLNLSFKQDGEYIYLEGK